MISWSSPSFLLPAFQASPNPNQQPAVNCTTLDFTGCASCLRCQQFKVVATKISTKNVFVLVFIFLLFVVCFSMYLWKVHACTLWPAGKLMALQKRICALLSCHCCTRYPYTALFAHIQTEKHEVPNTVPACQAYVAWCHPVLSQVEEMKAAIQCTKQDYYTLTVIRKKLPMKQDSHDWISPGDRLQSLKMWFCEALCLPSKANMRSGCLAPGINLLAGNAFECLVLLHSVRTCLICLFKWEWS